MMDSLALAPHEPGPRLLIGFVLGAFFGAAFGVLLGAVLYAARRDPPPPRDTAVHPLTPRGAA